MSFNNNTSFPVLLNEQYWKSSIVYSTILEFQYLNCRMFIQQYWKTSIVNSQYWKSSICIVEYGVSAILVFQYCLFKNTGNLVLLIHNPGNPVLYFITILEFQYLYFSVLEKRTILVSSIFRYCSSIVSV